MKVTSQKELMAEQARSAVRISGAHHSSWNRRQTVADPDRKIRGAVKWDNTIEYNEAAVNEPVREMFANARVYNQDPETLRSYREAIKTVLHENTHLLAAEGTDHSDAKYAFQNIPGTRALEEGITEVYSYNNLNDYIEDLGLEEIAPGISTAEARPSYKQFTPAAQRFAESIGRRSGLESSEVVRQLAVVNAADKFRVAAEILYDNSDLAGLVPDQERDAAVRRIETAMRPAFASLRDMDHLDADQVRRQSAKAGANSVQAAAGEMNKIRTQWTAPAPGQQVTRGPQQQASQRTQQQPEQAQEVSDQSQHGPQQAVPVEARAGGSQSSELQNAMRAGLSGTAQMSSARPLAAGEQGARRGGGQVGQERQGPERGE
ncbi:hypothetical protein [Kribbella sp. NPDC023855]|uniref:hypothetical protein n=1 Tax=Kribbella sp. NPDC023855 TaxID=3154698 RepID=UPI0033FE7373